MLNSGGFRLTKWISNSCDVLKSIPDVDRAQDVCDLDLTQDALPVQRALGVQWNTNDDTFGVKIRLKEKPCNRRGLLSTISTLYDPLGLVAPVVLQAKKLFQAECRTQKSWDDELDPSNKEQWLQWLDKLPLLEEMKWDRCLLPPDFTSAKVQLHFFCDASQDAYGTVCYLRAENPDGRIHCAFVMAKSRLAPMKTVTIPRLELQAAVMAVKMETKLKRELRLPLEESVLWTDSTVVLQYIRNTSTRFHTFVANRLSIIHEATTVSQWRYVDSKSNPADDVSRGLSAHQMISKTRWTQGPEFLQKEEEKWPMSPDIKHEDLKHDCEVKQNNMTCAVVPAEPDDIIDQLLRRYSCWFRLRRAVAWIRRFITKTKDVTQKGPLQVSELEGAERAIVRYIQNQTYSKEIHCLSQGQKIPAQSTIHQLQPVLDDEGILRVGGRLRFAPLSDASKYPMILPQKHHVSELIVRHVHQEQTMHSG
jgi:hypothetical protein